MIQAANPADAVTSIGCGHASFMTTVMSSGVSTASTADQIKAAPPPMACVRSIDALTAAAFNGAPSENDRPLRNLNVQVRPSSDELQLSARTGSTVPELPDMSGIYFVKVS